MRILITGVTGSALALKLLTNNESIVGIDNLNDYYDPILKNNRLSRYNQFELFQFKNIDIVDRNAVAKVFSENSFHVVIHLAAQPGVRFSAQNPYAYIDSNLVGL